MATFDKLKIKKVLTPVVKAAYTSQDSESDIYRNTLDIFSASLDSAIKGISREEWLIQEKQRQVQKTLQNDIGALHQSILGTLDGVENLGTGAIVDLKSETKHFIAEIKNKHNTTKGNHKVAIYDDLEKVLSNCDDPKTVGYYVEILPPNGKAYNKPFIPSDNKVKEKRLTNERIRQIDGQTFYAEVTGNPHALRELYELLPELCVEILQEEYGLKRNASDYKNMEDFDKIYGSKKD